MGRIEDQWLESWMEQECLPTFLHNGMKHVENSPYLRGCRGSSSSGESLLLPRVNMKGIFPEDSENLGDVGDDWPSARGIVEAVREPGSTRM